MSVSCRSLKADSPNPGVTIGISRMLSGDAVERSLGLLHDVKTVSVNMGCVITITEN